MKLYLPGILLATFLANPGFIAWSKLSIENIFGDEAAFANIIGVSQKAVEKWESGKNIPQGPAQRMLELLDKEPAITEKYLIPK